MLKLFLPCYDYSFDNKEPTMFLSVLETHINQQKNLELEIDKRFHCLEEHYQHATLGLKAELKKMLLIKIKMCLLSEGMLAILLVDIQNDFVLKNFALYASGGENTVLSNMALLDALAEIIRTYPNYSRYIHLITSQDAHLLGRNAQNSDAKLMESEYGAAETATAIEIEQRELEAFNPPDSYGLHCIRGTIGAALSAPIETRLHALQEQNIVLYRFGKINFSGPNAGMKLKNNIQLNDPMYLNPNERIYENESAISYTHFFQEEHYSEILISGICANVCVQQAAEGLRSILQENQQMPKISVLDACTHYLIIPEIQTYDSVCQEVEKSYKNKDINIIYTEAYRSNPNYSDELRAVDHLLENLTEKINQIDTQQHTAISEAHQLLTNLKQHRLQFYNELTANVPEARDHFIKNCSHSIHTAKPLLEHTVDWNSYLNHLLSIFLKRSSKKSP